MFRLANFRQNVCFFPVKFFSFHVSTFFQRRNARFFPAKNSTFFVLTFFSCQNYPLNNEPVPQVLKQVANLSCFSCKTFFRFYFKRPLPFIQIGTYKLSSGKIFFLQVRERNLNFLNFKSCTNFFRLIETKIKNQTGARVILEFNPVQDRIGR